jgi:hypothetical protein
LQASSADDETENRKKESAASAGRIRERRRVGMSCAAEALDVDKANNAEQKTNAAEQEWEKGCWCKGLRCMLCCPDPSLGC